MDSQNENQKEAKKEKKNYFLILKNKIAALGKTYKTILIIVFFVLLIDIIFGIVISNIQKKSALKMQNVFNDSYSDLIFLDKNSKKSAIRKAGFASFKFSDKQHQFIDDFYNSNTNAALVLRIKFLRGTLLTSSNSENLSGSIKYGFLTSDDFTRHGKFIPLKQFENTKINVMADVKKLLSIAENDEVDISLAFPKDKNNRQNIKGFFIYSDSECSIKNICLAPALLGFDRSTEVPFFGFSANGGVIDTSYSSVDFSSAAEVFPVQNVSGKIMPEIILTFSDNPELKSTLESPKSVKFNAGGEQIYAKNVVNADSLVIPSAALKTPFVLIDIVENKDLLKSFIMQSKPKLAEESEVYTPIRTDPGLILKYPQQNWRVQNYEVFEWDRFPGVLFFDTKNYDVQAAFFTRMAYFVEKKGFKGKILTNEQLHGKHGYNAHDYRPESMADFFNAADSAGIQLNPEEEVLRKILIKNGLLIQEGNKMKAGRGALVSISQESLPYLRTQLLAHEGWHTLFFLDEDFRNFVAAVYYTMDPYSRDFLIDYFNSQTSLGYDTDDDYLMTNEFMAYMMQQGLNYIVKYYVDHAKWGTVQKYTPDLADYIIRTNARGLEDAAIILNDYVFEHYGIIAGNIALINR